MRTESTALRWRASIGLGILGLVDSLYLTWVKISGARAACAGLGDCEVVNNSIYSEIGGVPIALLGAGAYLLISALLLLEKKYQSGKENLILATFGLSLVGTLYSVYLTYVEVAVLDAICPYCVVSAVVITALMVLSASRLKALSLDEDIDSDWAEVSSG